MPGRHSGSRRVIAQSELEPTQFLPHLISWLSGAHQNTNAREQARVHAHNLQPQPILASFVSP